MESATIKNVRPLSKGTAAALLGIPEDTPITLASMAKTLRATICPTSSDARLDGFATSLAESLAKAGLPLVPFDDVLSEKGRVLPGTVQFAFGEGETGNLAIDYVSTLYSNPVVAVRYMPPPVSPEMAPQEILNLLSADFVENMAHITVYVTEHTWTCCTMNGCIVSGTYGPDEPNRIAEVLVPKLAAPIRPLRKKDFETYALRETSFSAGRFRHHIEDLMEAAAIFRDNGMLPEQTPAKALTYRSRRYQRLGSEYLDNRTGMSYGFIARQLPVKIRPAVPADTFRCAHGRMATVHLDGVEYAVPVPEVSVLCTRSGCDKSNIDPERDIVKLSMHADGSLSFIASDRVTEGEAKPSYDTQVILAHAIGNAIVASLLAALDPEAPFIEQMEREGLAIAHWHDHLTRADVPRSFAYHGDTNPGVSCSSPQAALFALQGKLQAFAAMNAAERNGYRGDVHIEPHHGTNVIDRSLVSIGQWTTARFAQASGE